MIQEQHWSNTTTRVLITDEEHHGAVIVDILLNDPKNQEHFCADALMWSLWVDEPFRGHEVGTHLIEAAEREARGRGCKTMALEWFLAESERWVAHWYSRLGYDEKTFGRTYALMVKELNMKEP